jgi:hypothetical protein
MLGEHLQGIQIFGFTAPETEDAGKLEEIEIVLVDEVKEAIVW